MNFASIDTQIVEHSFYYELPKTTQIHWPWALGISVGERKYFYCKQCTSDLCIISDHMLYCFPLKYNIDNFAIHYFMQVESWLVLNQLFSS